MQCPNTCRPLSREAPPPKQPIGWLEHFPKHSFLFLCNVFPFPYPNQCSKEHRPEYYAALATASTWRCGGHTLMHMCLLLGGNQMLLPTDLILPVQQSMFQLHFSSTHTEGHLVLWLSSLFGFSSDNSVPWILFFFLSSNSTIFVARFNFGWLDWKAVKNDTTNTKVLPNTSFDGSTWNGEGTIRCPCPGAPQLMCDCQAIEFDAHDHLTEPISENTDCFIFAEVLFAFLFVVVFHIFSPLSLSLSQSPALEQKDPTVPESDKLKNAQTSWSCHAQITLPRHSSHVSLNITITPQKKKHVFCNS